MLTLPSDLAGQILHGHLTDAILHHNRSIFLHDKSTSAHKYTVFEILQLLVTCLESEVNDCTGQSSVFDLFHKPEAHS